MQNQTVKEYWEQATPMSFTPEKWSYEEKRAFRYELQDYMFNAFRFWEWKGKNVLEVGCGSGIDAVEFAINGANVYACDLTDNACNLTMALAKEVGVDVDVKKVVDNRLPYRSNAFDLVYSFGTLHHIPDVEYMMNEIHRVLRPRGKVMAMLYHRDSLLFAYSILDLHRDEFITESQLVSMYSERIENCPYTRAYSKEEARDFFSKWFNEVEVSIHYNVVDTPQQRKVKLGISDEYELGWHLVVKGVK